MTCRAGPGPGAELTDLRTGPGREDVAQLSRVKLSSQWRSWLGRLEPPLAHRRPAVRNPPVAVEVSLSQPGLDGGASEPADPRDIENWPGGEIIIFQDVEESQQSPG